MKTGLTLRAVEIHLLVDVIEFAGVAVYVGCTISVSFLILMLNLKFMDICTYPCRGSGRHPPWQGRRLRGAGRGAELGALCLV